MCILEGIHCDVVGWLCCVVDLEVFVVCVCSVAGLMRERR